MKRAAEADGTTVDAARRASPPPDSAPVGKGETLLGFQPAPEIGLDDVSPFVIKVLTYLKLQQQHFKYNYQAAAQHGMKGLPRGKLPCLQLEDGSLLPDSANIISTLESRLPASLRLDRGLSESQRAQALVLRRMVEESFYWTALVHTRWADDQGWAVTKKKYFAQVPGFFRMFLGLLRKNVVGAYKGQGTGRRPASEVYAMAKEEVDAMATLLGDQPFFLGSDRPTTIDCTLYAFLLSVSQDASWYPWCPIRQHLQSKPPLLHYITRMNHALSHPNPSPPKTHTDTNNDNNDNNNHAST